jgi:hypothetical protein
VEVSHLCTRGACPSVGPGQACIHKKSVWLYGYAVYCLVTGEVYTGSCLAAVINSVGGAGYAM